MENLGCDPGGSKHWNDVIFEIPEQGYPLSHLNGDVDKQSRGQILSVIAFLH